MTTDLLSGMGLSEEDRAFLMEKWETREKEFAETADSLRAELEKPLRAKGMVPGEGRDGLPDGDGFLAGLFES
ncbi:MAG: hypothetical protein FWG72_10885 [Oscillospiraceae bacterium]|nr:hypothetical protein [Oscillospiraceae bacterium]